MSKKTTKPDFYDLLVEGASEALKQYKTNHRTLAYPGMAKIAEALAAIKKSARSKTLNNTVDEVIPVTDVVTSNPVQDDTGDNVSGE